MKEKVETVIIGAGQAGLSTAHCLAGAGREHLVLERTDVPGSAWCYDRWDSFTLVTPNWSVQLPGAEYAGDDPDGFMPRTQIVQYFRSYASDPRISVRYNTTASAVIPQENNGGYVVHTSAGVLTADNVVVASGLFQRARVPTFAASIPAGIQQLASGEYRNPGSLPPGAVLVAGGGQSGCQIAEELQQNGRKVYLSVGKAGRAPRRYRGRDIFDWAMKIRLIDRTPDMLPTPRARFASNPTVTGRNGGHTLDLHAFARDGMTLLGRVRGADAGKILFAPDLHESLAFADEFETEFTGQVDRYIEDNGMESPEEALPRLHNGYEQPPMEELDLNAANVTSIVWALGYTFDFGMVRADVFDDYGYPVQKGGAASLPGLYFVGLPWLVRQKSGFLLGVGEDAERIAEAIATRAFT